MRAACSVVVLAAAALVSCWASEEPIRRTWKRLTNPQVHAFYYLWYGNPGYDGVWKHWNHGVLPHWSESVRAKYPEDVSFMPPHDIHAPFYPARGLYSSSNQSIIFEHLKDMRTHGIGVVVVSWWGRPGLSTGDSQGINTDALIDKVFEAAVDAGIQVALHLEPYPGRNITTVLDDIRYLRQKYDKYPSWYRLPTRRPQLTEAQRANVVKYEEGRRAEIEAIRKAKKEAQDAAKRLAQLAENAGLPSGSDDDSAMEVDANGDAVASRNTTKKASNNSNATALVVEGSAGSKDGANATASDQEEDDGPFYSPRMWSNLEPQPVFYVYDSYHLSPEDWARLLVPGGDMCIRGNRSEDGVFVGLWLEKGHGRQLAESGFDGAYTYFGSDGFSWGSTQSHWKKMANFARERDMMFVPCVSPGYDDSKIRPWNAANRRDRENGEYYARSWEAALDSKAIYLGITTYNEWGEGTQIEAAIPRAINLTGLIPAGKAIPRETRAQLRLSDAYSNYYPHDVDHYMMETLRFSARFADQVGFTEVAKDLRKMEAFHEKQKGEAGMAGVRYIHTLPDDERREAPEVAEVRAREAGNPFRSRFDMAVGPDGRMRQQ